MIYRSLVAVGVCIGALCFSGCASSLPSDTELRPAPPARVLYRQPNISAAPGRVAVIRDTGSLASIRLMNLYIEDRKVAQLDAGEYVILSLDPGRYQLRTEPNVDAVSVDHIVRQEITVTPGEESVYRAGWTSESRQIIYREPGAKMPNALPQR